MRYRLTLSRNGSWRIDRRILGIFWWTVDIRSGLDRAVERLKEIAGDGAI